MANEIFYDPQKEICEVRNQLSYVKRIGFLLGAGTSKALNISDLAGLTKKVREKLEEKQKNILKNERRNVLVVNEAKEEKAKYSGRNLQGVKIINAENINLLDLLNYKNLIITESVVQSLIDRYNK